MKSLKFLIATIPTRTSKCLHYRNIHFIPKHLPFEFDRRIRKVVENCIFNFAVGDLNFQSINKKAPEIFSFNLSILSELQLPNELQLLLTNTSENLNESVLRVTLALGGVQWLGMGMAI